MLLNSSFQCYFPKHLKFCFLAWEDPQSSHVINNIEAYITLLGYCPPLENATAGIFLLFVFKCGLKRKIGLVAMNPFRFQQWLQRIQPLFAKPTPGTIFLLTLCFLLSVSLNRTCLSLIRNGKSDVPSCHYRGWLAELMTNRESTGSSRKGESSCFSEADWVGILTPWVNILADWRGKLKLYCFYEGWNSFSEMDGKSPHSLYNICWLLTKFLFKMSFFSLFPSNFFFKGKSCLLLWYWKKITETYL